VPVSEEGGRSAPELFCPRCAAAMDRSGGELTCLPGDMGLSRRLETALLGRFGGRVNADAPAPTPGSSWYCPACRLPIGEGMTCGACGESLREFLFQLVELHPHRKIGV
jgi:hypothetical protein